ncbi:hypothetical protein J1605_020524 [Eschrichtius robustus]|uniref:RIB43A-like with coiled-coils protein 2 n=1 Tax=Eschrichtius robustus TaxID=9764 RepID=A0AB34HK02_ESCRO|nr:hypothetical protein J1605_020524 [Eschrichtius robustus]
MEVAQPKDLEEGFGLAKRRYAELRRQKRIFNARNRIIGGDTEAWDVQVCDQKIKEATEKARQETFEDLYLKTRLQFDETAKHLQNLESTTRKAVCAAVKEFNKKQALESAEKKIQEKKQDQEDSLAEISHLLHGDLLSENPQQAASSFGPHRVVPDRWKGMSREQLEFIRLAQKQQVQEKLRLQEEERQRDMHWDRQRVQRARAALLCERQQQCQRHDLRRALDCSNLSLAKEQLSQKKYMKEICTNHPTEDYFSQFNTRSR